MKIRITGTRDETRAVADVLRRSLEARTAPVRYRVNEISDFYPNRGNSTLGRVYVDLAVELKPLDTEHHNQERTVSCRDCLRSPSREPLSRIRR